MKKFPTCKDWDKKVKKGPPANLYHTTSDFKSVCEDGLMTRKEMRASCDKTCGLGGGPDDLISFTSNRDLARIIMNELKNLIKISQKKYDWESIYDLVKDDRVYKDSNIPKGGDWLLKKIIKRVQDPKEKKYISPYNLPSGELWKEFKTGWYERKTRDFGGKKIEEFTEEAREEHEKLFGKEGKDEVGCIENPYQEMTDYIKSVRKRGKSLSALCYDSDMTQKDLFDLYRHHYLRERMKKGGKPDPLFWCSQYRDFREADHERVGTVEVEGHLPVKLRDIKEANQKLKEYKDEGKSGYKFYRDYPQYHNLLKKYRNTGRELGFEICQAMDEIRLDRDRFTKLKVIDGNPEVFDEYNFPYEE